MNEINYCHRCGGRMEQRTPPGDNAPRAVCTQCGHIHYLNPKIVNACIIEHRGQILLGRRSIAPREHCWNVPAGFMENGESTHEGARREVREELCAEVKNIELFGVYNILTRDQVHVYFRAELDGESFAAGAETSEVKLFKPDELPWDEMAFPVGIQALERYCRERLDRRFSVLEQDIHIDYTLI